MQPIALVCPICRGALEQRPDSYFCALDQRIYPVTFGIPDLHAFSSSNLASKVEYAKATRLIAEYPRRTSTELMELYYSISPEIPARLAKKYIVHNSTGVVRAKSALAEVQRHSRSYSTDAFLEIGCGTGEFLVAATQVFDQVVGLDIEMCWLVIAKKQLEEAGRAATLACACAEHLPLSDSSFQLAVARDVIEHVEAPTELLREAYRVLRRNGTLFLSTPNRWSLALEPHVKVWGVGFLPKAWRSPYVRLVRKIPYESINTLSYFDVRRLLADTSFEQRRVLLPSLPSEHTARLSAWERRVVSIYHALKGLWPVSWLVYLFGPLFHIICTKAERD